MGGALIIHPPANMH